MSLRPTSPNVRRLLSLSVLMSLLACSGPLQEAGVTPAVLAKKAASRKVTTPAPSAPAEADSVSPLPSASASASPSVTPSASVSPSASPTASTSPSPSPSPSPSASASASPSPSPSVSASPVVPQTTVSTLAGTNTEAWLDGTGSQARFKRNNGMVFGTDGALYTLDGKLRRVTTAGVVTTIERDASSTAELGIAVDLVVDPTGNFYIASGNRVLKMTPAGVVSAFAGSTTSGEVDAAGPDARFSSIEGVAMDGDGVLYVTDFWNKSVRRIDADGVVSTLAGGTLTSSQDGTGAGAGFSSLKRLTVDRDGNLLVSDSGKLRKVTPQGVVTTMKDDTGATINLSVIDSVTTLGDGTIYVGTWQGIYEIRPNGRVVQLVPHPEQGYVDGPADQARYSYATGLAADGKGRLYMADLFNSCVRMIAID